MVAAYIVIFHTVMTFVAMAYIAMVYIVMAYVVLYSYGLSGYGLCRHGYLFVASTNSLACASDVPSRDCVRTPAVATTARLALDL